MEEILEKAVSLEDAQKAIDIDKKERAEAFRQELAQLCKKHNCDLQVGGIIIQPL